MRFLSVIILLISSFVNAQEKPIQTIDSLTANGGSVTEAPTNVQETILTTVSNDTILVNQHSEATLIDSLWLKSLNNSPLYDDFQFVNPDEVIGEVSYPELSTEVLKQRLAHLNSQTPFNVEYNTSLERLIKHYLKTRKETLGNLMGKAAYYFPMFEEHLDK